MNRSSCSQAYPLAAHKGSGGGLSKGGLLIAGIALCVAGCGESNRAVDAAAAASASPEAAVQAGQPPVAPNDLGVTAQTVLTCTSPVRLGSTLAQIQGQFGKDARTETMTGAEGIEYRAVVLWGDDPARRLELPFDQEEENPTLDAMDIPSARSHWRVRGLAIGDPIAAVVQANGKPFALYGFDWDYGGNVSDWKGGKLAPVQSCGLSMRLRPGADAKGDYASGDGSFLADDAKVLRARPVVDALGVVRETQEAATSFK